MLRTWFLTVFSLMNSSLGDLAVVQALGDQAEHLELALGEPQRRAPARARARHLLELVDQLDRHRRADQRLAVGDHADRLGDLLDRGVLEQVAGGAVLDRLVEVGLLVGDGEHDDLGRRHGLLDRPAGLDAGALAASGRRAGSTSGAVLIGEVGASTPSPASPTTSMSSSPPSSMISPRRNSSWSSTTSTRTGSVPASCRLGHARIMA